MIPAAPVMRPPDWWKRAARNVKAAQSRGRDPQLAPLGATATINWTSFAAKRKPLWKNDVFHAMINRTIRVYQKMDNKG
jgi:hypothetical protein